MATAKDTKKAGAAAKAGEANKGIEVIAKTEVFYRAGRQWGQSPTVVPLADLTEDELQELRDEPMLIVRDVEIKAEGEATAAA